jgi:hypothetical protein
MFKENLNCLKTFITLAFVADGLGSVSLIFILLRSRPTPVL